MVDRGKFNHIIEVMAFVSSHYPQGDFEKSVQQVIELRDHFDIKLMLVGHFSAGKSSLLNKFIGKSIYDLFCFSKTQESMINKYTGQLIPNSFVYEHRCHRRVYPTG